MPGIRQPKLESSPFWQPKSGHLYRVDGTRPSAVGPLLHLPNQIGGLPRLASPLSASTPTQRQIDKVPDEMNDAEAYMWMRFMNR